MLLHVDSHCEVDGGDLLLVVTSSKVSVSQYPLVALFPVQRFDAAVATVAKRKKERCIVLRNCDLEKCSVIQLWQSNVYICVFR